MLLATVPFVSTSDSAIATLEFPPRHETLSKIGGSLKAPVQACLEPQSVDAEPGPGVVNAGLDQLAELSWAAAF